MTGTAPVTVHHTRLRRASRPHTLPQCKDRGVSDNYSSEKPWLPPAEPWQFKLDARNKLDLEWLAATLDSPRAELLIRSHLRPLSPQDRTYKSNWEMFWRAVGYGDRTRIVDLMERWLAAADAELAAAVDPDSESLRQVRRFRGDVDQAYNRSLRGEVQPMGWAGPVWSKYPMAPRRVIEALVATIALHRDKRIGDVELYNVLKALGLDPGPHAERIDPDNLELVFNSLATGHQLDYS